MASDSSSDGGQAQELSPHLVVRAQQIGSWVGYPKVRM